jgi:hypothetical protein
MTWLDQHPTIAVFARVALGWLLVGLAVSAPLLAKNGAWWRALREEHPRRAGALTLLQVFFASLPMLLNGLSLLALGRPLPPLPPPPPQDRPTDPPS